MAKVELVEASLRYGQQSLLVSRLRERHAVAVAAQLDGCGFAGLEVFGGATFEAQVRFLGENPFSRLRAIRAAVTATPLVATIAGQALVGHRHVADDVVDAFVAELANCGVDLIRVSDPLNDIGNFERAVKAAKKSKLAIEGVLGHSAGISVESLVGLAKGLRKLGCDRLCIHDPLGVLNVTGAKHLTEAVGKAVDCPVGVAFSAQTGLADLACVSAVRYGAVRLDVALSPLAGGTSFPASEAMIASLAGGDLDTGLDLNKVAGASALLESLLLSYGDIFDPLAIRLDSSALRGQVPLTAMGSALNELRDRDALARVIEVEAEISRVRKDLGGPPLVTPLTEIVATQAVYNVCDGDRYLTISQEVKDYCLGLYGKPPSPVDTAVQRMVNGKEEPITCRPADLIEPALAQIRKLAEREKLDPSKENVLGMALFPPEWLALVRGETQVELLGDEVEEAPKIEPAETSEVAPVAAETGSNGATLAPANEQRELTVEVDGESYSVKVTAPAGTFGGGGGAVVATSSATATVGVGAVLAPMQGLILKVVAKVGDPVSVGDVVAVLEAMKMQNDVVATSTGKVTAVHVAEGTVVAANDPVVTIG